MTARTERLEFFRVPLPRRKLGTFPNLRAYIEEERSEFFQVPEPKGKLGIPLRPRAYMDETVRRVIPRTLLRLVLGQQAVFQGGGRLEFF